MDLKEYELSRGISLSVATDKKFKTNYIVAYFYLKDGGKNGLASVAPTYLAGGILTDATEEYPTFALLSRRLQHLYGASLSTSVLTVADNLVVAVRGSYIGDAFTMSDDSASRDFLELFCDCIFKPVAKNGELDGALFSIARQRALEDIEAMINNKRGYAISRAMNYAYNGRLSGVTLPGTSDEVNAVTAADAYQAHLDMFRTAQIDICFAGCDGEAVHDVIAKRFAALDNAERCPVPCEPFAYTPIKFEPKRVTEVLDVSQCVLVLVFKADEPDYYADIILDRIFGGSTSSKLFANVREKQSLCYFCSSRYASSKASLYAFCGVEHNNIKKAELAIIEQLEAICNGDFTDEDFNDAIRGRLNSLYAENDGLAAISGRIANNKLRNGGYSLEDEIEALNSMTRERIIKAASAYKLDTVYLLDSSAAETK